jgi:hypothetical protein
MLIRNDDETISPFSMFWEPSKVRFFFFGKNWAMW